MADFARGERFRELRKARHLSQEDAAHELKVSVKTVRAWEKSSGIHWDNARTAGKFYDVDPETLVTREVGVVPLEPERGDQLDRIERTVTAIAQKVGAELEVKDYEAARSDAEASEPTPGTAPRKPRAKQKTPAAQPKPAQRS